MGKPTDYQELSLLRRTTQLYTQLRESGAAPFNYRFTLEAIYQFFRLEFGFITNYRHEQTTPASTWTIAHNLGTNTTVQAFVPILSQSGQADFGQIEGEVVQRDLNTTIIHFASPESGFAVLTT